jgi:hypothetical protein
MHTRDSRHMLGRARRPEVSVFMPCTPIERCSVRSVFSRKTGTMLAALFVCLVAARGISCQFHVTSDVRDHAALTGHHESSTPQSLMDFSCLMAVLPAIGYFLLLLCFVYSAIPMWPKYATPTFPLFIPPRPIGW